jgi:hypothetical protein
MILQLLPVFSLIYYIIFASRNEKINYTATACGFASPQSFMASQSQADANASENRNINK